MHKVLIAHSSEDITAFLESIISCEHQVHTCSDGNAAISLLRSIKPDALILDLSLSGRSGPDVLREAAKFLPPVILATTWVPDRALLQKVTAFGVDYAVVLPAKLGTLIYRLEDLLRRESSDSPASVKSHLRKLSIPNHLDGYRQLLSVIPMKAADPKSSLTKEIYPVIVEEMQLTDWHCVDRSIRDAIQKGWDCGDRAVWKQYFPNEDERPKVSKFVAEIVRRITDNEEKD